MPRGRARWKNPSVAVFGLALLGCNAVLGNESASLGEEPGDGGSLSEAGFDGSSSEGGEGDAAEDGRFREDRDPPEDAPRMNDAGDGRGEPPSDSGGGDGRVESAAPAPDANADASPSPDARSGDAWNDGSIADVRTDVQSDVARCADLDGCGVGYNCEKGTCVPATVSCTAQKSMYAASPDGVYWINPTGTPMRAYCDMKIPTELCTEIEGDHRGRTREGSNLAYAMRSILNARDGRCSIWAVRGSSDGSPLHEIVLVAGQTLSACQALGFVGDIAIGKCAYGDSVGHSACGFAGSPLYQWGNQCSGCVIGDGDSATYVKQGPIHTSSVMSSFDGSVQTQCTVRP